jgi:hypothetical protein
MGASATKQQIQSGQGYHVLQVRQAIRSGLVAGELCVVSPHAHIAKSAILNRLHGWFLGDLFAFLDFWTTWVL